MLLFHNGVIHTMDSTRPTAEAVLVGSDGRIRAVGTLAQLAEPGAKRVNLGGRTLIPGFNDAHAHTVGLGLLLTQSVDVRLHVAPNMAAIIERFAQRARTQPPGTWIVGDGYNEALLPEGRHPTRHDLDQASSEHPIALMRTCGHVTVANSRALEIAGITAESADPPGGLIVRDDSGAPNGILHETAMALIWRLVPEYAEEELVTAVAAATRHQLSLGITSANDAETYPAHIAAYRRMAASDELKVRMTLLAERRQGEHLLPLPERYVDDQLRLDTLKFFADGGMTSATAAISLPYREVGSNGLLVYEAEDLLELMWEAHSNGWRIATHANGDVALEQVIGIYEQLHQRKPRPELHHRIEHMALPTAEHLARCARLGVMVATQTVFLPAMGATFRRYMPESYYPRAYGVRAMLDAGLTVALSSDAPVVPDDNPLLGMKAAVDRLDHAGKPLAAGQAITPYEALYAYTMAGAQISGDADNRGSITPGKWADLVVLSGDPLTTPAAELLDLHVEQTYVGGRLAYER